MRFRKVRSFLSAYSNQELTGKRRELVREQLADHESLRREALIYERIAQGCRELPTTKLSDDFNARLLNRIAQERFAETRSKAFFPKSVPGVFRRFTVPAMATVAVVLVALVGFTRFGNAPDQIKVASEQSRLDDSYLTVHPDNNPHMFAGIQSKRSLEELVSRVDRATEISNWLTGSTPFGSDNRLASQTWYAGSGGYQVPFRGYSFRVRPILRVKTTGQSSQGGKITY